MFRRKRQGTTLKPKLTTREQKEGNHRSLVTVHAYCVNNSDIDEAFKAAAIYGIYSIKIAEKQNTISFPILSSTMISDHLIPYLPEQYTPYTFKKTSWKKAATFLKKYLEKEGIIKTKDRGGETIILSINWYHKLIAEFQPYTRPRRPAEQTDTKSTGPGTFTPQMVEIRELYKPTGKALRSILESLSKS